MTLEHHPSAAHSDPDAALDAQPVAPPPSSPEPVETRFLKTLIFSEQGVRVGWMAALFMVVSLAVAVVLGITAKLLVVNVFHIPQVNEGLSAPPTIVSETASVIGLLVAAAVCSLIERRRIQDYYLRGPNRALHFVVGSLAGFAGVSALVGALFEGHLIRFGPHALSGSAILEFALLWALAFFGVGLNEEGSFRCYLLFTLARGIDYWWALGTVAVFSLIDFLIPGANGVGGVYLMAGLGVVPCLLLHLRRSPSAGFWEAAWVTSTLFGFLHTGNAGETWIGIFSAALIGFVFCVSVRLTGSAWWAIGFHAAWDWTQTFFYGTADSGLQAKGHYLTTDPAGAVLWSGGSAGPEGSILVIPVVLAVLIALVAAYGRKKPAPLPVQQIAA